MFIGNNSIANDLYVPYTQQLGNLAKSAQKLATGERIPTAASGAGEVGLADSYTARRKATSKLIDGMTFTLGIMKARDEVTNQVGDIIVRMIELAGSAADVTKNTTDRMGLEAEIRALEDEFTALVGTQYGGISLFGNSLTIRLGLSDGLDVFDFSAVTLGGMGFADITVSQLGHAESAIISLQTNLGSLNVFRARAGVQVNHLQNIIDTTRIILNGQQERESAVRNIDLAKATGEFTRQQVVVAAAQNVLAQANGLAQSVLTFLG